MKNQFLALATLATLAACAVAPAPQTSDEMRAAAPTYGKVTVQKVSRSYGSVVASLRAGSRKCFNRTIEVVQTTPSTLTVATPVVLRATYKSAVRARGGKTEMVVYVRRGNGGTTMGMKQEGVMYVADARPVAGGTQLNIYSGRSGFGPLNAAVIQWANGGAIRCPEMP